MPLTATVAPADAAGTVTFSSGEHSTGPVEVVDGIATGELTFPEAGDYEVTASFTPANAEAHTASSATRTVTVAGRSANLAVTAAESAPARGHVEATATVGPGATGTVAFRIGEGAEVTAVAAGEVIFTVEGRDVSVDVADNVASLEVIPDRSGEFPVKARFVPADDTQTPAEAEGTLRVVAAGDTVITAQAPTDVEPMVEAPTTVTVDPAAAGVVTATVDGRKITADVDAATGTATLPLVFPREGDYTVPVEFTPADPRTAKAARTSIDVTVTAPAYDSVTVDLAGPNTGVIGEQQTFRATVTPNAGDKSAVSGFLTLTNNGKPVMKDGAEVRIPVVRGIADFDMAWPTPGAKTLEGTFVGTEGKALGTGTATVTITDENGEIPPTDGGTDENPDTGGDLPSNPGTGSSDIRSFFERLWKFIVDLFTGKLTPGTLGSSNGSPNGSSDRPGTDDVAPAETENPTDAPAESPTETTPDAPAEGDAEEDAESAAAAN